MMALSAPSMALLWGKDARPCIQKDKLAVWVCNASAITLYIHHTYISFVLGLLVNCFGKSHWKLISHLCFNLMHEAGHDTMMIRVYMLEPPIRQVHRWKHQSTILIVILHRLEPLIDQDRLDLRLGQTGDGRGLGDCLQTLPVEEADGFMAKELDLYIHNMYY